VTTKSHRKGGFSVVMYANLDAHEFCRGYGKPLAMMGVALYRYLPGCNAMLANEVYVSYILLARFLMCPSSSDRNTERSYPYFFAILTANNRIFANLSRLNNSNNSFDFEGK
jgi:hypothetical protein